MKIADQNLSTESAYKDLNLLSFSMRVVLSSDK